MSLSTGPSPMAMSDLLARNWWAIALRGAAGIVFGLVALLLPFAALGSLMLLLAAYLFVDGVFAIVAGVRAAAHHERWVWLILEGVVNLIAGAAALLLPGLTLLFVVTLLGIWSVISGVFMLAASLRLHAGHGRWWLALSGLVSVIWGVVLYASPIAGAVVLTWWLGAYALAFGAVLLVLAVQLRRRRGAAVLGH